MRTLVELGKDRLDSLVLKPIEMALSYWYHKSELSADRVAAVVCGDAKVVIQSELKMAGVPESLVKKIDIGAWAAQMDEIEEDGSDSTKDSLLQSVLALANRHSISALRVRELLKWAGAPEFSQVRARIESGDFT